MSELRAFQSQFARALLRAPLATTGEAAPASWSSALTIHRNTLTKGLVDALAANYPTIEQLVGREWFTACAIEYVHAHPAHSPALVHFGAEFAAFLSGFGPAAELPYLAEVARIDRLWIEAYTAQDSVAMHASALSEMSPTELFAQQLPLHPATRFGWFNNSAVTVWLRHRSDEPQPDIELDGREEGILLTRPGAAVAFIALDRAGFMFLEQLSAGATLGEAATATLETTPNADVARLLAQLVTAGAFQSTRGESQ